MIHDFEYIPLAGSTSPHSSAVSGDSQTVSVLLRNPGDMVLMSPPPFGDSILSALRGLSFRYPVRVLRFIGGVNDWGSIHAR